MRGSDCDLQLFVGGWGGGGGAGCLDQQELQLLGTA